MRLKNLSKNDLYYHFKTYQTFYFMFLFCMVIGIVLGFIVVFANDDYLKLLTSENKSLYPFINGTGETGSIFWKTFSSFSIPFGLIFLLNLTFYTGIISLIFIGYQSALLVLSCASVVGVYGVSGIINILFFMLPVNLLYFVIMAYLFAVCFDRGFKSFKNKMLKFGFNKTYYMKILLAFVCVLALTVVACVVYPLFLKNSIFIIY